MLKAIKCVVIVSNIGKSAYKKICAVKKRWTDGYRKTAVMDGALVLANIGCTAIMLYDPWILMRPFLMIVPYAISYIPAVGGFSSVNVIKTVLIYGLEFVQL